MMTSNPSLGSEVDDDKENQEVDEKDLKGEDDTTCGWFGFRPGCMQVSIQKGKDVMNFVKVRGDILDRKG